MNEPEVIFDSRQGAAIYAKHNYYRSSNFYVPPGFAASIELTAHSSYMGSLLFTAIRIPPGNKTICYSNDCLGKVYRRWLCCRDLGENVEGMDADAYSATIVRWGWDWVRERHVDFEYITRPGNYYLIASKATEGNAALEDSDNPTIIDMTLVPNSTITDLL